MALNWKDKQDGVDEILAKDINDIANAVIETQEELKNLEKPETDLSNYYNKKETEDLLEERINSVNQRIEAVETQIGDIDTALDSIIALQNSLIGGDSE